MDTNPRPVSNTSPAPRPQCIPKDSGGCGCAALLRCCRCAELTGVDSDASWKECVGVVRFLSENSMWKCNDRFENSALAAAHLPYTSPRSRAVERRDMLAALWGQPREWCHNAAGGRRGPLYFFLFFFYAGTYNAFQPRRCDSDVTHRHIRHATPHCTSPDTPRCPVMACPSHPTWLCESQAASEHSVGRGRVVGRRDGGKETALTKASKAAKSASLCGATARH